MANKKYIVTRNGVSRGTGSVKDPIKHYEIGDELELTEAQAAGLIGKVRLKSESSEVPNAEVEKLKKQLEAANAEVNGLKEQLTKLTEQLTTGKKAK